MRLLPESSLSGSTLGRVDQKRRKRAAIVAACRRLITAGADINMPAVARAALVSEPTAYRYFPDLASLLEEALAGIEPDPAAAVAAGADPDDPVERVAYAAELLGRLVIDQALAPLSGHKPGIDAATLEQLRRDLAVVISAEALLTLTDLYGLDPGAAVASVVHTARLITEATLGRVGAGPTTSAHVGL